MSVIKKIKTSSSDDRGEIIDIFTHEPKDHCVIVTFKKNAIRGNHFHKKSIQSAFVLEGSFKIYHVKTDENANYDSKKIEELDASKNDYITHEEYEAHAYKCLSNKGTLLVFTKGVRGGKYYEDDTFRLNKKLT